MRKRLALLWMPIVLLLALMLPATTAAASYGAINFVNGYCSGGNTVHATFKMSKYSGFYANSLSISVKGQGFYNGGWHNELNIGTWYKNINTYGSTSFTKSFYFIPGHSGSHRILATGRIWNGGYLVASGKTSSGYCG
jgi:hypothetical protein